MSKSPKISIIIPVYNACPWLEKCLQSVCEQSLSEIEIIAVDDGSTDQSLKVLADFQAANFQLHICRQDHLGVAAARNTGLQQAHGQTVVCVDADDYLDPKACQILFDCWRAAEADIAVGQIIDGKPTADPSLWNAQGRLWKGPEKRFLLRDFNIALSACMKLFSRRFLEDNSFRFEQLPCWEDALFSLKTLCAARTIVLCPSAQYIYVKHTGHHLSALGRENFKSMLRAFSLGTSFLQEHPEGKLYQSGWRGIQWICLSSYLESANAAAGDEKEIVPYMEELKKIKLADLQRCGWKTRLRLIVFKGAQILHLSYRRIMLGLGGVGRLFVRTGGSVPKK